MLSAGFVDFDDDRYVTENPRVLAGVSAGGVAWALTSTEAANWHPLTWLSHMLDASLHGADPRGHHLTSLALHAVNAVLLLGLLRAATGSLWRSAAAAALFAVHPLHVESVAWVAERKDVLSAAFFLLAAGVYLRRVRAPGGAPRLGAVAALFALGLAAKPMVVTLPLALLALDWWPLGRLGAPGGPGLRRLVLEKWPLFALAAAAAVVTLVVQREALAGLEAYPAPRRAADALVSYARYLARAVAPAGLTVLVPVRPQPWSLPLVAGAAALLAAGCWLAAAQRRRRPYLAAGGAWFLILLLPVIGLVQAGRQAIADRYTYLPLVGIFVLVSWLAGDLAGAGRRRAVVALCGVAVIGLHATMAHRQARYWRDDLALFGRAVAVDPANWQMRTSLGVALAQRGKAEEALVHLRAATVGDPGYARGWYNFGHALELQGRHAEALGPLERAVALDPGHAPSRRSLGAVLLEAGRDREAAAHLAEALRMEPADPAAAVNLGLAFQRLGDPGGAARWYREALRLDPQSTPARAGLASLGQAP